MKRLPVILAVLLITIMVTSTVVVAAPPKVDAATCSGTYTVVAGDYLSLIASRCSVAVSDILALNPDITNPNLIFPGQVINVTGTPSSTATTTSVVVPVTSSVTYTTVSGDTLASVTNRFEMNAQQLLANNPGLMLAPGQVITISTSTSVNGGTLAPGEVKSGKYLALAGDTLRSLATKFRTSVDYMVKYNPNISSPDVNVGGLIIILPSM
jgi:LysM repeat protein